MEQSNGCIISLMRGLEERNAKSLPCLAKEPRVTQSPGKETRFPQSVWGFWGYFLFVLFCYFFCWFFFSPFPLKPLESLECVFVKAATCRGLNSSFSSVLLLANSPQLASAFSLDESLTLYTWAEVGSAGPFWGLVQGQIHQHQSLLFLQFVSKYSLH